VQKAVGEKAIVEINKEKPGKGNFVITVSGYDTPVVELLGMQRPFPALKNLDMEEITGKVVAAVEEAAVEEAAVEE